MAGSEEYETVHYGNYIHDTFTSGGKERTSSARKETKTAHLRLKLQTLENSVFMWARLKEAALLVSWSCGFALESPKYDKSYFAS